MTRDMKSGANKDYSTVKAEKIEKFSVQMNEMANLFKEGLISFSKNPVSQ